MSTVWHAIRWAGSVAAVGFLVWTGWLCTEWLWNSDNPLLAVFSFTAFLKSVLWHLGYVFTGREPKFAD